MHSITAEVAIVGAGTAGCFIASLLDNAGIDCVVMIKKNNMKIILYTEILVQYYFLYSY